jgi:hypothetical protein
MTVYSPKGKNTGASVTSTSPPSTARSHMSFAPSRRLRKRRNRQGPEVKYAFIQRHRRIWPIRVQCRGLCVSISGYHQHQRRRRDIAQRRHLSVEALLVHIRAVYAENREAYGWPASSLASGLNGKLALARMRARLGLLLCCVARTRRVGDLCRSCRRRPSFRYYRRMCARTVVDPEP